MIKIWLETPFEGGRYARRNEKITLIEQSLYPTKKTQ
jgi:ribose 5-phosphate isomerase RpiB